MSKMINVFVNPEGRYLARVLHNKKIDTTKYLPDAMSWDDTPYRVINLRSFMETHKELISIYGLELKQVEKKEV